MRVRVYPPSRQEGRVLIWRETFGWIMPDSSIDHEEAWKHNGKVYVNRKDTPGRLFPGARVSFFAYADGDGIGAEDVIVMDPVPVRCWSPAAGQAPRPVFGCGPGVQRTIMKSSDVEGANGISQAAKGVGKGVAPVKGRGKGGKKGKPVSPMLLAALGYGPKREKTTHNGGDGAIRWASSEMQGWRPAMEDATAAVMELQEPLGNFALFGVFDGHGGAEVSRRVSDELPSTVVACAERLYNVGDAASLPERAFEAALPELDARLRRDGEELYAAGDVSMSSVVGINTSVENAFSLVGSTAVVALVECDAPPAFGGLPRRVVVANVGDSRAVLCRAGKAVHLSEDQKPEGDVERERIERAGGHVAKVGPCFRVDGCGLNLSRAFGDFHYKARDDLPAEDQKVTAVPVIQACDLSEEDEFLLLGCDGVFELHEWQDAVDVARQGIMAGLPLEQVVEDLVDKSCSGDLIETQGSGSDNVSAMIVLLR